MDFDLLVFLLIFLAPLLKRLFDNRGKQPKPKQVSPELEAAPSEQAQDPLGEALRQIREVLGEPTRTEKPQPATPIPAVAKPDDGFHSLGKFEHDAHGFGPENPISEEVFEQRPAFQTRGRTERIRRTLGEVDLTTPLEVKVLPTDSSHAEITRRLRTPERAREAFVLKEILDAPRSRRRLR